MLTSICSSSFATSLVGNGTITTSSVTLLKVVPAIIAREVLLRNDVIRGRGWLNLFVISLCLAFSALYEIFEWLVAIISGDSAESFLGTQGYVWDTQSDMATALFGAVLALALLSKLHDRELLRCHAA
jgi:putative membrane protein